MYLRTPRFQPKIKPVMISFEGYEYHPEEYVIEGAKAVILYPDSLDRENKKVEYILSDPQLQRYNVVVSNHVLLLDYGYRYIRSYEEIPEDSLYISRGWGSMPPFTQKDFNHLLGKGVYVVIVDVTKDKATQQWKLNCDTIRLWLDDNARYARGDNEPVSLLDPNRSWIKGVSQII